MQNTKSNLERKIWGYIFIYQVEIAMVNAPIPPSLLFNTEELPEPILILGGVLCFLRLVYMQNDDVVHLVVVKIDTNTRKDIVHLELKACLFDGRDECVALIVDSELLPFNVIIDDLVRQR